MLIHSALAMALGTIASVPAGSLISAATTSMVSDMSHIEEQMAADTNVRFERENQAISESRAWANRLHISNCIADIEIEVIEDIRGKTTISHSKAKFHLSRISRVSRQQGISFGQEILSLNFHPDEDGKTPVRTFKNGVEKPFHYLRSGISLSYQSAAAADRTVINFGKLQQMCGLR